MRKKGEEEYLSGNLTAMIDVVFQLIIFFVCTVSMQENAVDASIRLAMAPHGEVSNVKNPLEINVDVDRNGVISVARVRYTEQEITSIFKKVAGDYGPNNVPVNIRGDGKAKHGAVRAVMDACARAGIWKIKISALKERG